MKLVVDSFRKFPQARTVEHTDPSRSDEAKREHTEVLGMIDIDVVCVQHGIITVQTANMWVAGANSDQTERLYRGDTEEEAVCRLLIERYMMIVEERTTVSRSNPDRWRAWAIRAGRGLKEGHGKTRLKAVVALANRLKENR